MPFDLKRDKQEENIQRDRVERFYQERDGDLNADEIEENDKSETVFAVWDAPEFEKIERSNSWYIGLIVADILVIVYALFNSSPLMAITFILIGVVGFLMAKKEPEIVKVKITSDGVVMNNEIYTYENISSFWIFYEPPYYDYISLKLSAKVAPKAHIPLADNDPVEIRRILLQNGIKEEKQEITIIDALERMFHL